VHAIDVVDLWVHPSWRHFRDAISRERCWYFSANAERSLWDAQIPDGAVLVFGNEGGGMPERILGKHPERCYRIPMGPAVRSLNLATAVGIVLYDTLRRLGYNPPAAADRPARRSPARAR
jgi:tRNA (cytidine/uridine-2'-O-)-methyltransferase